MNQALTVYAGYQSVTGIISAVVCLIIALSLILIPIYKMLKISVKTTQGKLVKHDIQIGPKGRKQLYVQYEYTVDGTKYTNDAYSLSSATYNSSSEVDINNMIDKLQAGMVVYYEANKPNVSYLVNEKTTYEISSLCGLVVGLFGGIALAYNIFIWKNRNNTTGQAFAVANGLSELSMSTF
jgi:hypothetical protein